MNMRYIDEIGKETDKTMDSGCYVRDSYIGHIANDWYLEWNLYSCGRNDSADNTRLNKCKCTTGGVYQFKDTNQSTRRTDAYHIGPVQSGVVLCDIYPE